MYSATVLACTKKIKGERERKKKSASLCRLIHDCNAYIYWSIGALLYLAHACLCCSIHAVTGLDRMVQHNRNFNPWLNVGSLLRSEKRNCLYPPSLEHSQLTYFLVDDDGRDFWGEREKKRRRNFFVRKKGNFRFIASWVPVATFFARASEKESY